MPWLKSCQFDYYLLGFRPGHRVGLQACSRPQGLELPPECYVSTQSVGNSSLLGRIDVCPLACFEKERGHVFREKRARLWVHDIQAVMIDQHRLLLSPICPTLTADLGRDPHADLTRKRGSVESFPRLSAAGAGYGRHGGLRAGVFDLRQSKERQ